VLSDEKKREMKDYIYFLESNVSQCSQRLGNGLKTGVSQIIESPQKVVFLNMIIIRSKGRIQCKAEINCSTGE
jgi:hypothetical protein